jgi:hypothetical protein
MYGSKDLSIMYRREDQAPVSCLSSSFFGAADTALAELSGAGGSASARYPQSADSVGNVSARSFVFFVMRFKQQECLSDQVSLSTTRTITAATRFP